MTSDSREVYVKVGRRYKPIGHEFTGFPVDGVWLVQDGSQNCIVRLCDVPKTPRRYPEIAIYENECATYMMEKAKEEGTYSILGLARWAAEFYAMKIGGEDEGNT
jgi:hypothetical protein